MLIMDSSCRPKMTVRNRTDVGFVVPYWIDSSSGMEHMRSMAVMQNVCDAGRLHKQKMIKHSEAM